MELDELRTAWQALGRQLECHDALQLRMYRSDRLDAARRDGGDGIRRSQRILAELAEFERDRG